MKRKIEVPAGKIIHFPKRTESIAVKVPPELNEWLQGSADALYMTKASYVCRLLWAAMERQRNPRNPEDPVAERMAA